MSLFSAIHGFFGGIVLAHYMHWEGELRYAAMLYGALLTPIVLAGLKVFFRVPLTFLALAAIAGAGIWAMGATVYEMWGDWLWLPFVMIVQGLMGAFLAGVLVFPLFSPTLGAATAERSHPRSTPTSLRAPGRSRRPRNVSTRITANTKHVTNIHKTRSKKRVRFWA